MTYFKVVISILVSEDYLYVAWVVRVPRKIVFVSCMNFFWGERWWMIARINILKGIPGIFIVEEVKTTTKKFEDILRCFKCWSNTKEQYFYICVQVELCFPWIKNSSETFQDQNPASLTFTSFINDSLKKALRRQAKILALPSEQVKGDIVTLINDVIFQFRRHHKLLFNSSNTHQ